MSRLTKNTLQERHIFNGYELAELQDEPRVWVAYTSTSKWETSGWRVHRVDYTTGSNHEDRTFWNWGRDDKEAKRLEALAWASERYKIVEWERSPFGSYHPVGTLARAELKGK